MSRAKELRTNQENVMNFYDIFEKFVPEKKSKYVDTLLRLMKKTRNIDEHIEEIKEKFLVDFNIPKEEWEGYGKLQIVFLYRLIDNMFNVTDLQAFQKFCEYNERNLIKQNDLSTYNSFEDITNSLSVAEIIAESKELEKHVKIVLDNDEWLLVRPLTFHSSKKYGSNTKWCTTQENNPDYFMKYASRGVLIYCINKKSGYKVASFYSLDKNEPEFSFWNQKDTRVDSLDTELTDELRTIIFEESKGKGAKTNRFLLSDDERRKEEKSLKLGIAYKSSPLGEYDGHNQEPVDNRTERIRNRIERVLEEENETTDEPDAVMMEERLEEANYEIRENLTEEQPTHNSSSFNFGN
ncbi:MAG: hypothetical protein RLZ10_1707 [Bacteroidota bacterium]|jgi:hypothetical protein